MAELRVERLAGQDGGIVLLGLDRPASKNALGRQLLGEFRAAMDALRGDRSAPRFASGNARMPLDARSWRSTSIPSIPPTTPPSASSASMTTHFEAPAWPTRRAAWQ